MYIETSRMMIRPFQTDDAAGLHAIFGDDLTMENCEPAYSFEKTKQFLSEFCIGRKGALAALHRESGMLLGYILFKGWRRTYTRWVGFSTGAVGGRDMLTRLALRLSATPLKYWGRIS